MNPPSRRPRLSLGIVMVYIALVGIMIAPYLTGELRGYLGFTLPYIAFSCLELGVLLAFRHLSRWIWVLITSMLTSPLLMAIGQGLSLGPSFYSGLVSGLMTQGLFLLGLGMTFREVNRRLQAIDTPLLDDLGLASRHPLDGPDQGR